MERENKDKLIEELWLHHSIQVEKGKEPLLAAIFLSVNAIVSNIQKLGIAILNELITLRTMTTGQIAEQEKKKIVRTLH